MTHHPPPQHRILMHQSGNLHRSQFLHEENSQNSTYYLLFVAHQEAIIRHAIKTTLTATGLSLGDPSSVLTDSKRLHDAPVWYQWDMLGKRLYFIALAKGSDGSPHFLLKSFIFSQKGWHKPDLFIALPLEVCVCVCVCVCVW